MMVSKYYMSAMMFMLSIATYAQRQPHLKLKSNANDTIEIKTMVSIGPDGIGEAVMTQRKLGREIIFIESELEIVPGCSKPKFKDGDEAFEKIVANKYLTLNIDTTAQGKIYISFIVEYDGSLSDVRIFKSLDKTLDKKLIKRIEHIHGWIPGIYKNKFARTRVNRIIHIIIGRRD